MNENNPGSNRPTLELVAGGIELPTAGRPVRVFPTAEASPPFPVEARVFEEDTFFVLSAPPVLRETTEHPIRLMTDLYAAKGATPGSVVVKGRRPYRFLAVVHDVEQTPTWREEWIARALVATFVHAEGRGLTALALPVLGAEHGDLEVKRFGELLGEALSASPVRTLQRIWLMTPAGQEAAILEGCPRR